MKKLVLGFLAIAMLAFSTQAQEDPGKALRKASNALKSFELDQNANLDKLHEAVDLITIAIESSETNGDAGTWQVHGDIHNAVANQIVTVRQLGFGSLDDLPQVEYPALIALDSYLKALEMAEKRYHTKDALKGLRAVQNSLNNLGIYSYEDGDYAKAYEDFNGVLTAHRILVDNNQESMLADDSQYQEQLYIAGLAALNANDVEAARPLFEELTELGYDKPAIYEALYKIASAGADAIEDEAARSDAFGKAYPYLEEGRTKFPDDVSLLFAEINHFLRINKLDVLIEKLEAAIEKEPDNVSLYSTLGNVYDNLYQKESEAGNTEKATEYFDKALAEYGRALEKDPDFTDATYSIGALYFNRAANMTLRLSTLADDFSKEGQAKYDELKVAIEKEFDKALPYFMEVEKKNPADINTLIALKEIFARKSDFEKSTEFKTRLEAAQAGEELESYFLNN